MNDTDNRRVVLIIAGVSSFLVPFMGSSINIALPAIGAEFKMGAVLLSWVPTSYLLASAIFLLFFSRIGDIYGRKKIFLSGMIVYTFGALISALSISGLMLIVCRLVQGVGSAMTFGTSVAILTSVYPQKERGRALGIISASVYSGLSLGPFLGGFLTQHVGWRSLFYLNVPIGLIVIIMVLWRLRGEWAEAKGDTIDLPGSIIYAAMLISVMYGLSLLPSGVGFVFLTAGGIGALIFFFVELRTNSPLLDVRIFRSNPVFTFSISAALIHYCSTFAVTFLLSLYLQYIKGFSAQSAGMILICQPIIMALFSPLSGRLSDRIEPRVLASIGMACSCLGTYLLSFIGEYTGLTYIVINLIILGFGFGFFSSPNTNAVMSSVERRYFGLASGTLGTIRLIGQMLSMGMAMMILSIVMGKVRITPDLYPLFLKSLKITLVIGGTLCFFGIFSSLARGRVRPHSAENPT
jgi:EmrB/QacA subfamily drug resistance transporter